MKHILNTILLSTVLFVYGGSKPEEGFKKIIDLKFLIKDQDTTTDLINEIDSLVSFFNSNISEFTKKEYPASEEESSKDHEIILYTNDDLKVLIVTSYASLGKTLRNSYFKNDILIKIEETEWTYDMPPIIYSESEIETEEIFEYYYSENSNLLCKSDRVTQSFFPDEYKLDSSLVSELYDLFNAALVY